MVREISHLKVLVITSEWPTPEIPYSGVFVQRQVESLRNKGIEVDIFHFRGGRRPANYLKAWRIVREKLSAKQYDLVHAQWGQSALLALPKRLPLVITFRGSDLEGIVGPAGKYTAASRVLRWVSRLMALAADQIIVVSKRLAQKLPDRGFQVIPTGVDLDLFKPIEKVEARRLLKLDAHRKFILFAGSIDNPVKRYELAKSAVEILNDRIEAELLVPSGVPHELMPVYMSACDVLLLTSVHEGSPNVVKEALACNLRVVSVDVGDVRERIGAVEGCAISVDDSPVEVARALEKVLSETRVFDGRSQVEDLDESLIADRVKSVYEDALDLNSQKRREMLPVQVTEPSPAIRSKKRISAEG